MKVLHLDSGREMRGGQWQVVRLVEGLAAAGVESTLLARRDSPLLEAARRKGLRAEPLTAAGVLGLGRRHDLIHAHDARSHTLALFAPGIPLVVSRRVAFPIRSPWKYQRPRRFVAVSEFVKLVLQNGGVPGEKIDVVYDGVPLLTPRGGAAVLAVDNSSDPQKGAALATRAAELANVPLRFAADLECDLADAALFVYITHSEGLGSAVLLALSAGVPVVASNIGGLREIIRDGENGLLVENSVPAIADAIRTLVDQPDLAARLGQAGRRTIEANFTTDRMVHRTMEVYCRVLS
jgi:hypothetical protein